MKRTLVIGGMGIKFLSQLTLEVKSAIENCDIVLYLVNEPASKQWIIENSKHAISLDDDYFSYTSRINAYEQIEKTVIKYSLENKKTCFITYGHPFLLSSSALNIAKKIKDVCENTDVVTLPGISSLDCMFCDLMIDPGRTGIQAFEATDFLLYDRDFSISSHLVLWQIGVVGIKEVIENEDILQSEVSKKGVSLIQSKLFTKYPPNHPIFLYVASQYPSHDCSIIETTIDKLTTQKINRLSTAYIPPLTSNVINATIREQLIS